MGLKVTGLKEAKNVIKELQDSFEPTIQDRWTNNVANRAKEICDDPDCKRIRLKRNEHGTSIEFDDAFAVDCIVKAIEELNKDMPFGIREWFNKIYIPQLQEQKKKMTDF